MIRDHQAELDRIFKAAALQAPANAERVRGISSWAVCGIGKQGRKCAGILKRHGALVEFFIDAKSGAGMSVEGAPCFRKEAVPPSSKDTPVLVAIHNPQFDAWEAKQELLALGFTRVFLLQEAVDAFPEMSHFWLAPSSQTLAHFDQARAGLALMADGLSRDHYSAILAFRLLGEKPPSMEGDQYFPLSIPAAPAPLRWVDCGAFDGDTLDYAVSRGLDWAWCAAFEPDPDNYALLRAKHAKHAILMPFGVGSRTEVVRFIPDGTSGQVSRESEGIAIQMVSLDEALGGSDINFLKMDIEGAELDALDGAKNMIANSQPRLAIASYHRPEHLWQIPERIAAHGFSGSFMLRIHANNTFDAVIYGIEPSTGIPIKI